MKLIICGITHHLFSGENCILIKSVWTQTYNRTHLETIAADKTNEVAAWKLK